MCNARMMWIAVIVALLADSALASTTLYYSFQDDEGGGLARMTIDSATGAISQHSVVFHDPTFDHARKLAISACGKRAILINAKEEPGNLAIINLVDSSCSYVKLDFPTEPDEVRTFGDMAVIGGNRGNVVVVDMKEGRVVSHWNARRDLRPSGHKVEDIRVLACGELALMTFQKDSSSGRHRGSRLVVMQLPELQVRHDMHLPRNRPDLHYPVSKNLREQGPNPEVIIPCLETNTLFLSLDLYGAVAMTDLDQAVRNGVWDNLVYLPTAVDGGWGNTFPDRMVRFARGDDRMVVVCNAGPDGGSVVIDLSTREIVQRMETGFGLETPTYLPGAGMVIAASAGKLKARGEHGLDRTFPPRAEVHVFAIERVDEALTLNSWARDKPWHVFRLVALDSAGTGVVALFVGEDELPTIIAIYDVTTGEIITTVEGKGAIHREAVIFATQEDSQTLTRP